MNLSISTRHMEHSESVDQMIKEKLKPVEVKHLGPTASVQWTSWVEHDDHYASAHVLDKGHDFFVKADSENMYKTIDLVVKKLEAKIKHSHS
jgi:putative sigma-54 modulation protein